MCFAKSYSRYLVKSATLKALPCTLCVRHGLSSLVAGETLCQQLVVRAATFKALRTCEAYWHRLYVQYVQASVYSLELPVAFATVNWWVSYWHCVLVNIAIIVLLITTWVLSYMIVCVSLIEPIHVRFNQTTYSVVEGKRSVSITLETLASHTCSFSVIVSTRNGTASCEWQTKVYV